MLSNIYNPTKPMEGETYYAKGKCTNCGRKNHPQWGAYPVGTKISDQPCPQCGLMTWVPDTENQ